MNDPDPSMDSPSSENSKGAGEDSSEPEAHVSIRWVVVGLGLLVIGGAVGLTGQFPGGNGHYGIWSIVPPLIAIVLAFWTREVISALFLGIVSGGVIAGDPNIVQEYMIPAIGTEDFALILLVYLWALGGLIGIWTKTGGAVKFAGWAGDRIVRDPRSAKFFTWLMGLVFHQGGTISTVLTGATVRPVTDRHNISHEETSFLVDSTASPAATLIPFNVWPIYVGGLVAGTTPLFETTRQGIAFFFASLPYNFYAIFALFITLLFALDWLPFVPGKKMRRAVERSRSTGKLDRDGANPLTSDKLTELNVPSTYRPGLIDFVGPIGLLLGVAIVPYFVSYFLLGRREDPILLIAEAFVLAVLAALGIAMARGMSLQDAMEGFVDGCSGVTIGAVILALAVTLKEVADAVGTADYVVEVAAGSVPPAVLPALMLGICLLIAFSTGTSWGTYAVVFPVAMPLAWAIQPDPFFITLCFSAVVGGSVFGDQCSPISDTTILSSLATGCDLMDHVYTQIPLAATAGIAAAVFYVLFALMFV